jgi:peroxiredoxin Q/BCP
MWMAAAGFAQPAVGVSRSGPQIGERLPEWSLNDQYGQRRTLQTLTGRDGLMLVFIRSVDDSTAQAQLADVQAQQPEIARAGLGVGVIGIDATPVLRDFAGRHAVTVPLLSDSNLSLAKRIGIVDAGRPFPGTFVIDRSGRVRQRFFATTPDEHVTVRSQLLALGATLASPVTTIGTAHAQVTTFISDTAVRPGGQFSLVIDVVPVPGMRLIAESAAAGPLSLSVSETPGVVMRELEKTPTEIVSCPPPQPRVAGFTKPFRLTQRMAIGPSIAGPQAPRVRRTLMMTARLRYEACTDSETVTQQSVPLSWRVEIEPLEQ